MKRVWGLVAALCIWLGVGCSGEPPEPVLEGSLLIRGVTLIDGTGAPPRPQTDLLIRDGRIARIGSQLDASEDTPRLAGEGRYVVPGLIDTHAHLDAPVVFQLTPQEKEQIIGHTPKAFLYNGVTTILNVSSDVDWIFAQREAQRSGTLIAPRIYAMGRSFTPEGGWGSRHGGALTNVESVRQRAQDYISRNTDGFKVVIENGLGDSDTYREIPDEMLQAIAEVAAENNLPVYVHAINLDAFRRAIQIRPRAIIHGLEDPLPEGDPLLAQLIQQGTYVVPTHSLWEAFLRYDELEGGFENPVLRGSVPTFLLERMQDAEWVAIENQKFREVARIPVYDWAREKIPVFCDNIRKMNEAGVQIGVGTDAGGPVGYNFQGYNTPWELKLLVQCGLSPMEAVESATRIGAEIIGIEDELGILSEGRAADLLVLSADPLQDIGNIRAITHVMQAGRLFERQELAYVVP